MEMTRLFAFGVIIATMFVATTTAFAEFKAPTSHGQGKITQMKLEAGGAEVDCEAFDNSSKAAWTIASGGKEATKGPDILVKVSNWGKCSAESSEIKRTKAELNECELQTKEPESEQETTGKADNTCIVKVAECEIKIVPKENESLKDIEVGVFGEASLAFEPMINNVTTAIAGKCPGITSSKTGVLEAAGEMEAAQPDDTPEFAIRVSPATVSSSANQSTVVFLRLSGNGAIPANHYHPRAYDGARWSPMNPNYTSCTTTFAYTTSNFCSFTINYVASSGTGAMRFWIDNATGPGFVVNTVSSTG